MTDGRTDRWTENCYRAYWYHTSINPIAILRSGIALCVTLQARDITGTIKQVQAAR